jgi:hypothetical protein
MTDRFERMWKRKDVYWEEDPPKANAGGPRPVKKRKKSKPIRAKTPIVFPNLREQDDAISELLSAQVETSSRMELASMAETALELSLGQEESQTQWLEQSFFDVFMVSSILWALMDLVADQILFRGTMIRSSSLTLKLRNEQSRKVLHLTTALWLTFR